MARTQAQKHHLEEEILDLEARLENARSRLASAVGKPPSPSQASPLFSNQDQPKPSPAHALLLLSDSALPLGSFAYSNGLESYLAHLKSRGRVGNPKAAFDSFLALSIASMASTSLPYLLAAYRQPDTLETIDNDLDASTLCVVAQRASLAQGQALLGVWQRAFRAAYASHAAAGPGSDEARAAIEALEKFSARFKTRNGAGGDELGLKGHLAPLWGVVSQAMGLTARQAVYVYMVNHAKAVLSAAVRASVIGPYQAQSILASQHLQEMIAERIEREWETPVHRAGQLVPTLDLWFGRHDLLYSRIFNS